MRAVLIQPARIFLHQGVIDYALTLKIETNTDCITVQSPF